MSEFGCYRCGTLFSKDVSDRQSVVCPECGTHLTRERAETTAVVGYEFVRNLHRRGPQTVDELGDDRPKGRAREAVGVLEAPSESPRTSSPVYYLWGSERQAVRHFILQNTEWAREQVRSTNPVAKRQWPDPIWALFLEEWELLTEEGLATREGQQPDADA